MNRITKKAINGAAKRTAKTPQVSTISGHEIKNGAGTVEQSNLQSIVTLCDMDDGEKSAGIWMDKHGQCYIGSYSGGSTSPQQPTEPKLVTATEALRWFSEREEHSIEGSGDIAPVIRAALRESVAITETETEPRGHLIIALSPTHYGFCCEAGVVHGCKPEEALSRLLDSNDFLTEWSNHDFDFDVDLVSRSDANRNKADEKE